MAHMRRKFFPAPPGETLAEDFRRPLGLSMNRLVRYFGTPAKFWTNLQTNYDLEVAADAS